MAKVTTLDEAVGLGRRSHGGAVDEGAHTYLGYPPRVMARVSTDEENLAAVVHDLLEDTELQTDLVAADCTYVTCPAGHRRLLGD